MCACMHVCVCVYECVIYVCVCVYECVSCVCVFMGVSCVCRCGVLHNHDFISVASDIIIGKKIK